MGQKILLNRSRDAIPLLWGLVIALGVCAPFIGDRRLFLLDWSYGPIDVVSSGATLGLNGGLIAGNIPSIVMALLNHILGSLENWLPIFLFFPIASIGIGRLVGTSRWAQIGAASLYCVNPFVFNRLFAGQIFFLLGYAFFPFALACALNSPLTKFPHWLAVSVWWAILTAFSPHFAWIYGLTLVAIAISFVVVKRVRLRRLILWFLFVLVAFVSMSAYIYLPTVSTTLLTKVGVASLALYRTSSDPHLGLYTNVAALYGFWRLGPGPQMAKDVVTGWPFLMSVLLIVISFGMKSNFPIRDHSNSTSSEKESREAVASITNFEDRAEKTQKSGMLDRRSLARVLLIVGISGYFLALGDQGPTGGIFTWMYNHIPFFNVMREPQKFLLLLVVAYAVFFGWGVEYLKRMYQTKSRTLLISSLLAVAVALPLGYTVNMFDGLGRQILPSTIPHSYQEANTLMGRGDGSVLALPWHLYMSYPFTNNRVVANIASSEFNRNVISGDNVESGGIESQSTLRRSLYLETLFQHGQKLENFGRLVSPLGVQFISLAKSVDWRSYDWLNTQSDLRLVLDTPSLEVWRNMTYYGVGERVSNLISVSTLKELLSLSNQPGLGGAVYLRQSFPASVNNSRISISRGDAADRVRQLSPVAYKIDSGKPGWVAVDAPFEKGWFLNGRSARDSVEGTLLIYAGSRGGTLEFAPWSSVKTGYLISIIALLIFLLILSISRWRGRCSRDEYPQPNLPGHSE